MKKFIASKLGLVCGLAAAALYIWTISPGAFPGDSAKYVADYSGVSPFLPILHPLWWGLVRLAAAIPLGPLALRLNLLSLVCGAVSIGLVYHMVAAIEHDLTAEEKRSSFRRSRVQIVSGLVAAGFLATAIPFWIVSTRAHPLVFNVMLLLLLARLLQLYYLNGRLLHVYLISFGLGLALVEFPTMLLVAPVMFLTLLYLMFRRGLFNRHSRREKHSPFLKWILRVAGLMLLGALPAIVFAIMYRFSPAYEWRDFPNFLRLLIHIVRSYIGELSGGFNQLGWLLVSLVSLVPFAVMMIPKHEQKKDHVLSSFFMHVVLSAVAIAVIFNYHISPWALYGERRMIITPYLMMAVWIGYLAGYWMVHASKRHRHDEDRKLLKSIQRIFRILLPLAYTALLLAALVLNRPICDGRAARPIQRFARDVIENMSGRQWLISNGLFDDMIAIAACDQRVDLEIINPRLSASRPYLRYLSSKFDNPRLKGLALLGLPALVQEWFKEHPAEVEADVAVLSNPDLWLASEYNVVPHKLLYFGRRAELAGDDLAPLADCTEFWSGYEALDNISEESPSLAAPWNRVAVGHVSKAANNTGFVLQTLGANDQALAAYRQALLIDEQNASALLNVAYLAEQMGLPEADAEYQRLEEHVERMGRRLNSWNLSYMYGYVFEPMSYVNRGLVWAMSGKPDLGVEEIKRAVALGGKGEHLQVLLAGMYFMQREQEKSEEVFLEILEENPDSLPAIRGMLRLNVLRGRFDMARGYLLRLEEAGEKLPVVRLEEAVLESIAGDKQRAKRIVQELIRDDASNLKAWNMLALIATEQNDRELQQKCLDQFRKEGKAVPRELLMAMAQVAITQRETTVARRYIDELLYRHPYDESFLEWRLRIDVYEFNREEAEQTVERLMGVNPRNPFANYIMGTLHIYRDQFALAEPFLRVCVEGERRASHLNTLAYVLYRNGKLAEAKPLVREALELDNRHGPAWDTYGMILYSEGVTDEALEAVLRALDFQPENPEIRYHLAQIYEQRGEYAKAMEILDDLMLNPTQFSMVTYNEVRRTANSVRAALGVGEDEEE